MIKRKVERQLQGSRHEPTSIRLPRELNAHVEEIVDAMGEPLITLIENHATLASNIDRQPYSRRSPKTLFIEYLITESIERFRSQYTPNIPPLIPYDDPLGDERVINEYQLGLLDAKAELDQLLNTYPQLIKTIGEDPREKPNLNYFDIIDLIKEIKALLFPSKLESVRKLQAEYRGEVYTPHLARNPEDTEGN